MSDRCTHLDSIDAGATPSGEGCAECLASGGHWRELRRCVVCGHVGCCDSSPSRHARSHWEETGHTVVQSFEPGEDWFYCFEDDALFFLDDFQDSPSHP
jgi:hypothetical protein